MADPRFKIKQDEDGNYYVKLSEKHPPISVDISRLKLAYYWLVERHRIWEKKELLKLPAPWTQDETLAKWKFINIHRKLDKGTRYILKYLQTPDLSDIDIVFNILRYRLINNRHSHEACGGFTKLEDFNWQDWYGKMRYRWENEGQTVLCVAHNTCTYSTFSGHDKIARVCGIVADFRYSHIMTNIVNKLEAAKNFKEGFDIISKLNGFGPFLAYEVMLDLSYVYPKFDTMEWANIGPGCARGLEFIFSGHKKKDYLDLLKVLKENLEEGLAMNDYPVDETLKFLKIGADHSSGELDLRVFESQMCEYSKYIKLSTGTGRNFGGTYRPSKEIV